jgi:hypothetical protein
MAFVKSGVLAASDLSTFCMASGYGTPMFAILRLLSLSVCLYVFAQCSHDEAPYGNTVFFVS